MRPRCSGQMVALPACAASTCSQTRSRRQRAPTARTGSTAPEEVVPTVAQTIAGMAPASPVRGDGRLQRVDAHGVTAVGVDQAQVVAPQAGDLHRFLDRGVGVAGGVDGQPLALCIGGRRRVR